MPAAAAEAVVVAPADEVGVDEPEFQLVVRASLNLRRCTDPANLNLMLLKVLRLVRML